MRPPHDSHAGGSKPPERFSTATLKTAKRTAKAAISKPIGSDLSLAAIAPTTAAVAAMATAIKRLITRR